MNNLSGVGVALVTPFNEDLSVDFDALTDLVEFNIANKVDYLVVLGTTAETATLNDEEKDNIKKHIAKINNRRLPLVLGVGGNNTLDIVNKINEVDSSVFQAILSVSPYYNKPNQEGLYRHYKALALTGKNIILYNVPGRTAQNIDTSTCIRLATEFENIFMIKEAGQNITQYFDILRLKPDNFKLVSGEDEFALPVTLAGADGVISVIAQAYPKQFSRMIRFALEGKVKDAYEIHNKMVEIIRLIFSEGNPTGIKSVLSEIGIIKNYLRLPLVEASDTLQQNIRAEMRKL